MYNKTKLKVDFIHANLLVIAFILFFICQTVQAAKTTVPLLSGENKNEKGENIPMPERFTKIFSFIEKDLSIELQLQLYPWNRAVKIASTEGGLIFGLSITPDREKIFTFSNPALYQYLWLVTRTDRQFTFNSLVDLKGKTIGVLRGAKYGGEFDAQKNILFKTDDDIDAYGTRLKKLITNRIDAMIYSSPLTNLHELEASINAIKIPGEENTGSPIPNRFSVLPIPVLKDGIRFAILTGQNDQLIFDINRSLQKFQSQESRINSKQNKSKK